MSHLDQGTSGAKIECALTKNQTGYQFGNLTQISLYKLAHRH